MWSLAGRDAIVQAIGRTIENAQRTIFAGLWDEELDKLGPLLEAASARGIDSHVAIYGNQTLTGPHTYVGLLALFSAFYFLTPSVRAFAGDDFTTAAYSEVFGWFAIACTFWVTINQILCSIATIRYHRQPEHRSHFHWWRTLLAPTIGGLGLLGSLVLLWSNLPTLGGDVIWVQLIPWACIAWFLLALVAAFWLRARRPAAYEGLGRVLATTADA